MLFVLTVTLSVVMRPGAGIEMLRKAGVVLERMLQHAVSSCSCTAASPTPDPAQHLARLAGHLCANVQIWGDFCLIKQKQYLRLKINNL